MTPSKKVIAALSAKNSAIRSGGFPAALALLSESRYFREAAKAIIPDGYEVRHETAVVAIYEVVDTHPIRPDKAIRISELSDELDDIGWSLIVLTLDYTGHITSELSGWAYLPAYTATIAPDNCLDMTPAARAVAREMESGPDMTMEELRAAMNRIL